MNSKVSDANTITIAAASAPKEHWEWRCLLTTLDKVDWQIRGRRVHLKVFGDTFNLDRLSGVDVHFVGQANFAQTAEFLSEVHILYCSQSLDKRFAEDARKTIPAELYLLLRSGKPLIFHSPEYSAAAAFLKAQNAALLCHSAEAINIELYNCIDRLIFDQELYAEISGNGREAAMQEPISLISANQLKPWISANN